MEKQTSREKVKSRKFSPFMSAVLEVCFIIFLFYSNLLMGEFTHGGAGYAKGFIWAVCDIFTWMNLTIAIVLAIIAHLVFEFLRKRV